MGDKKKTHSLEVKKLDIILAMVNDPEEVVVVQSEEDVSQGYFIFKNLDCIYDIIRSLFFACLNNPRISLKINV